MNYMVATLIAVFFVFLFIYKFPTIISMAWSGKLKFQEKIYNINRETDFFPHFLEGFQFKYTIDLGCGYGLMGQYLRGHTEHLVGVDVDRESLKWARKKSLYDELILADIRQFEIPRESDSIFLIEVLEHLDRKDGEILLKELQKFPFVCIITPTKFHECYHLAKFTGNKAQKHQSVWSENDFQNLGYTVHKLEYTGVRRFHSFILGKEMLAIRDEGASLGK